MNILFETACEKLGISNLELIRLIESEGGQGQIFAECLQHPPGVTEGWDENGHWAIAPADIYQLIWGDKDSFSVECVDAQLTYRKCYIPTLEIAEELFERITAQIPKPEIESLEAKPLGSRERNTLYAIIAALCEKASTSPNARGLAGELAETTRRLGVDRSESAILTHLQAAADLIK